MTSIKMPSIRKKSLSSADEVRTPPKARLETVQVHGARVGRMQLEPGWKWSESIQPIARTEFCEAVHRGYVISGRLHVAGNDGLEVELGPGDVYAIEPGHDAWVVGDEPYIALEFEEKTVAEYALPQPAEEAAPVH